MCRIKISLLKLAIYFSDMRKKWQKSQANITFKKMAVKIKII